MLINGFMHSGKDISAVSKRKDSQFLRWYSHQLTAHFDSSALFFQQVIRNPLPENCYSITNTLFLFNHAQMNHRQVRAFELVLRTYSADPYDYYKTDRTAIKMLLPISNVKIHEKFNYPIPMVIIII